ncbi:GlcG/HbpS family heme-binding protein [Acuticoccus mangrovi]|uniref:Heme-binding protein n=1 Tax=Acuticoccus mangrovi TaxID=2796142 RepID=A0A934MKT3_9HYPH|nr:heme-binding protein [Acuticoccus mangrovi]MBJ3775739.1 heme-binding protein [Acuticoccus mangrovi]
MLTTTRLDAADARILIEGAAAKAREIGRPMNIAITCDDGHLIAFERMDGAKITSITIAIDKAFTAAAARAATHDIGAGCQPGGPAWGLANAVGGRLIVVGGGMPVVVDDVVVGGIGVSSGTPMQDREVAEAGLAAFFAAR